MLGEGLAGPLPGDQDPAAAAAEVGAIMGRLPTLARLQAGAGVLGLDPVAEPGNWSPTRRCGGRFSHQWFAGRARPHDERSITASIVSIRAQRIE